MEEIEAKQATVLAVSFETRDRLFQLSRQVRVPFPLLSDTERDSYRAYGLTRGGLRQIAGPGTIWRYVKLITKGEWYHFSRSDLRQLGGDFVLDQNGIVRFEHRSRTAHDRPPIDQLLEALDQV